MLAEQDQAGWDEALSTIRSAAEGLRASDLVVTLLLDQSGSMKGARIAWAAVLATRIDELLARIGARSEILGFTTAGWRGGHAYAEWRSAGRPSRPGRLCALMHIVYKSAEEVALTEDARNVMLDPALLRENVDGEAVLWAWRRLAARPERHKILIVVSDGAPVDDATLMYNGPSYLYRHLIESLALLEEEPSLTIGGIGLCHDVASFYPLSERVDGPDELSRAAAAVLERTIAAAQRKARSVARP